MNEAENWKETIDPLWRLVDPLTIRQAAALIAGYDPNAVRFDANGEPSWFENESGFPESNGISRVLTAFKALVNAINARKLKATIRRAAWERGWDEESGEGERFEKNVTILEEDRLEAWNVEPENVKYRGVIYRVSPDWNLTTAEASDLVVWLEAAGYRVGFFFPTAIDTPDYLDPKHLRYAPKLAAAVQAWQAMEDENLRLGKSAKTAMEQWLESNYKRLGLTHKRSSDTHGYKTGDINKTAVRDAAKIANWEDDGGSPSTPSE